LDKSLTRVTAVLAVLILASSGAAFAHFASNPEIVESKTVVTQPQVESASTDNTSSPNPVQTPVGSQPCTKSVTESSDGSGTNAVNVKKTEIHCQSQSGSDSTSIDVQSSSDQSATTGDSTGRSGAASNSDTTDVQVN
jgi:hypothetical protein